MIQKMLLNKRIYFRLFRVFQEMLEKFGDDLGIKWRNILDNF